MFPIEAARWALSLEVIRVRRTGEEFKKSDLKRVRALVRELSSCTPAMARQMVTQVAVNETFSKALGARFMLPPITPKAVIVTPKKKKSSKKKKVIKGRRK
jgi:hypothetical protein